MGTISRRSLSVAAAVLAGALALWTPATLDAGGVAAYGAKITFTKGKPIAFRDFQLEYLGPRSRKTFWLELTASDTLGRLKPNQLVISYKGPAS